MKASFDRSNRQYWRTKEWKIAHETVMRRSGRCCEGCHTNMGAVAAPYQVHHIVSPLKRPDLACEPSNLKYLCAWCHHGGHLIDWGIKADAANDPFYDMQWRDRIPPSQLGFAFEYRDEVGEAALRRIQERRA